MYCCVSSFLRWRFLSTTDSTPVCLCVCGLMDCFYVNMCVSDAGNNLSEQGVTNLAQALIENKGLETLSLGGIAPSSCSTGNPNPSVLIWNGRKLSTIFFCFSCVSMVFPCAFSLDCASFCFLQLFVSFVGLGSQETPCQIRQCFTCPRYSAPTRHFDH